MDHLCLVFLMLSRLFIAVLWLPGGKGWTLVGDVYCIFVTFPCGVLGQVWYLIVSLPDPCPLSYFYTHMTFMEISGLNRTSPFLASKVYFSWKKFRRYG